MNTNITEKEKNKIYNDAYEHALNDIKEAIINYTEEYGSNQTVASIKGHIQGKIDFISTFPIDFNNIKLF